MSIEYSKIKAHPQTFIRLFGIKVNEFEDILEKVTPLWEERVIGSYKRPGRFYKLSLANMILIILLYYRSYITQLFVGMLFGIDDSRVCRIIKTLEPILATVLAIKKERNLPKEEVESLIIDTTEQPRDRPKKNQKSIIQESKNVTH